MFHWANQQLLVYTRCQNFTGVGYPFSTRAEADWMDSNSQFRRYIASSLFEA